ncbi:MAG: hypothetical protein F4Y27_00365 [Acidimicrobiaceae bacterium]|nr:hypothetical protein [Acidimicrobiaceae bacterium]MXW62282.1 hypothetical protein [Acidimicrobiaceae bacterium]MXW77261.1 hypothetical protein [Acidimicrobiaceae bacterium]MYA73124.1 hypothetical protein [Acidimicrobiaceae bacterium]MYC42139.1 hypothetical protein [Acidimicrobiaceae bacterium]
MEIHRSAFKHGLDETSILHALNNAVSIIDLDPDADPPKVLLIGPDRTGNLIEVIWLDLDEEELVIHAMPLRSVFYELLPPGEEYP